MIDFRKQLNRREKTEIIDPIEIYKHLDRASDTGELRSSQEIILSEWHDKHRTNKDTILKLHTGRGKTLIGLLMLQSKLNEKKGPVVYLCPNRYLVSQTAEQAERFGVPYVIYLDGSRPEDLFEDDKVVITTCQKMFNGLSSFGIESRSIKVNTIIMDDAHLCAEVVNESFRISVDSEEDLYSDLLTLFTTEMKTQGEGTFINLTNQDKDVLIRVPYWDWQIKHEELTKLLSKYTDENSVKFKWPLLKDVVKYCTCIFSSSKVEIYPEISLIEKFGSYHNAECRIFMSATTSDDSQFIKDLGVSKEAVLNPLNLVNESWNGEKMILIPSKLHKELKDDKIRQLLINKKDKKFGIVALTSSFYNSSKWSSDGVVQVNKSDIIDNISDLKNGKYENLLVFASRYDGIDLPDSSCRILVIDGKPTGSSLEDKYYERTITNSDVIHKRAAQKFEQGLGRSVRGEKDYSIILILGDDLIRFIKSSDTQTYFSDQTRTQIDIGLKIIEMFKESITNIRDIERSFIDLMNQSLKRDSSWKEYYEEQMNNMKMIENKNRFIEIFSFERIAEEHYIHGRTEEAIATIQKLIDNYYSNNEEMKGWYLQKIANFQYYQNPTQSNQTQINVHKYNPYLLKPKSGMEFTKMDKINTYRNERIKSWIENFESYDDMMYVVNENISFFEFGISADKFERTLDKIGVSLGFVTERPEKIWKDGPDNLWRIENSVFLLFECKNEVKETRNDIHKSEAGQINTSCAWFRQKYPDVELIPFMIIPTINKGYQAHFNEPVKILNRNSIELFKTRYYRMFTAFKDCAFNGISIKRIQEAITNSELHVNNLIDDFGSVPKDYKGK